MDFLCVDFETPTQKNDSICSMGITLVINNKIEFNENVLINPKTEFDNRNIRIHGITKEMVKDCPTFGQVWEKYKKYFNHYPVVMHNADFDTSVLYKAAYKEKLILPDMDFYCTKQLCEENYPMEKYTLTNICKCLGMDLCNHDSGSDSLCTAQIMISIAKDENSSIHIHMDSKTFFEKAEKYANRMEREEKKKAPNVAVRIDMPEKWEEPKEQSDFEQPECEYSDCGIYCDGSRFVFTGEIEGVSRSEAIAFVESQGGKATSSVSKKTNYVIVGLEDKTIVGENGKSRKIEQAEELIAQGYDISIVEARRFIELMESKM